MKNINEYRKELKMKNAYKEASDIQENLALASASFIGTGDSRPNQGFLAVQDLLNKIDAMNKMFESTAQQQNNSRAINKIIDIIDSLYELAQIKLIEARKQSESYMRKASGVMSEPEMNTPEMEDDSTDEEPGVVKDRPENKKFSFNVQDKQM